MWGIEGRQNGTENQKSLKAQLSGKEGKGEIWDLDPRILIPIITHIPLYLILFPHNTVNEIYNF